MNLIHALRFRPPDALALVGAGGKTSVLFRLAREITASSPSATTLLTASTHLGTWQAVNADRHLLANSIADLASLETGLPPGATLVTGPLQEGNRLAGAGQDILYWLREKSIHAKAPLLVEADGSRQKPLKAPAEHEPPIPDFVEMVVVMAGLSGLYKPLTEQHVHRPEIFARLSGLEAGQAISPEAVVRVLSHPAGGLKNIPAGARRVILLNQAETPELQSAARRMAQDLLESYDAVVVASLQPAETGSAGAIHAVHEQTAGIVLAAGESSRFGRPKQLLEWRGKPFVRHSAEAALTAGLSPVVVVTGACAEQVEAALQGLPVTICRNPDWQSGQSASLQCGLRALPPKTGAALFLLADQPQVTPIVLRALVERHSRDLSPILAPQAQGRRANPVLFDRQTFAALMELRGDVGGRAIFSKFPVAYLPWHDESLLVDVDRVEDLEKLP